MQNLFVIDTSNVDTPLEEKGGCSHSPLYHSTSGIGDHRCKALFIIGTLNVDTPPEAEVSAAKEPTPTSKAKHRDPSPGGTTPGTPTPTSQS